MSTQAPEKTEPKDIEQVLELGDEELGQISEKTKEAILPELQDMIKTAGEEQKKQLEELVAKLDKGVKKGVNDDEDKEEANDPVAKGIKAGLFDDAIAKESKEMRLYKAARALANGDLLELKRYNAYAMAAREKAGYGNEAVAADGQVLVPDPEFDTTVYDALPSYGVAFKYATIRQTDRNAVYALSLDTGLSFYATAEAGTKTGGKLSFSRKLTSLQKYAVIVPATDELTDDAAIDYWNLVTRELTRAYAKVVDEITFTDASMGVTNTSGVITQPVSGAGTTVTWDDLLKAESKIEDDFDTSNYRWFMRKETWFRLVQLKGSTNDHYLAGSLAIGWVANPNTPTTPWGTPVVFTRVLPTSGASAGSPGVVGSNDAFAVYGDLANYLIYNKRGMDLKMLSEATVKDSAGNDFNLATQDGQAMRAVIRLLGILPKGNAPRFVIVGTGTVS